MAIPAGPSESVEFKPKLSLQKIHALRTTPYSPSTKVRVYQDLNFLLDIQNKVQEKLSTVKDKKDQKLSTLKNDHQIQKFSTFGGFCPVYVISTAI